jgi:multidrug efflux pump subunit AcrB
MTAIAALIMTFFLDEHLRLYLFDFSVIVIVNLAVSLFIALFLIPALLEKLPLQNREKREMKYFLFLKRNLWRKFLFSVRFTRFYGRVITFVCRFRCAFIILAILGFGLPVHMLPDRIDKDNLYARTYNQSLGSDWYRQSIKPITNKILGGAMQLFNQNTFKNSYYGDLEKTTLYIDAKMPFGSTLNQINELVTSVENYLKQFTEIEQFQTIVSAGQASITIHFKKNFDNSEFPFQLQEMVTQKANDLGGADWAVQGVGEGFHNAVRESLGQYRVTMYGYNYDVLLTLAEKIRDKLMENARIKDITIMSRNSTFREESIEYVMDFDRQRLVAQNVSPLSVYSSLMDFNKIENVIGNTVVGGESERLRLVSKQSKEMDLWQIQHTPGKFCKAMIRLNNISDIKKEVLSQDIVRENHQYRLILSYDYIGRGQLATQNQKQILHEVESILPLGYTIEGNGNLGRLNTEDTQQYWWLLIIIIAIIYFICSVLFESLLLPLAVVLMIPLSYIGVFLTFPLFNINFDQGGFDSFILLSGITVNSALYIINDFNNLKRKKAGQKISTLRLYLKAYNQKIFPILLTILSTMLGLVPFLLGGKQETFWPALAAGTIGGLIFSLIALWIYLPMILIKKKSQ